MKAFIIHGTGGHPDENWIPWLRTELNNIGCEVIVPKFPTPIGQSLDNWLEVFEEYKNDLDNETIIIGHSVGVAFILNILERHELNHELKNTAQENKKSRQNKQMNKQLKAAFLVSGFTGTLNNPTFDLVVSSFSDRNFNWKKIRNNCAKFHVFHSDNDPFVNIRKAHELAERLETTPIIIKGGGHFTIVRGYIKFPQLLEKIKGELS